MQPDTPETQTPARRRILVADDHEDNVELLRARLEARGFEVHAAQNGEQALELVEQVQPDLILLDVMMPRMDGMEVARRMKANPRLPFIPIIMQTALDTTESKVEGLDAGADDYITKPINFAELEARVKSLLRIKALQDALSEREKELQEMNDKLLQISRTDGLTMLDNRRHLEERLDEMFEHSRRLGEPLACMMCDLDRFKSVNDTYGHQAGDEVLRQTAQLLLTEAREIDRVGRYGGEEFMLLLPGTVLDAAVTFAERVRGAVEAHTFTVREASICRTLSAGVASYPFPGIETPDDLVRAADDALYVAKESGRNKVVRFASPEFIAHTSESNVEYGDERPVDIPPADGRGDERPAREDRPPRGEDYGASARA
jgi:two-component system, cell cycle response regulator